MSDKRPAFQFYPKDYLSDENVMVMSLEEQGAYIRLMSFCWLEGSIPADTERMAKLCFVDGKRMAELWQSLESCFSPHPKKPGRMTHPRLDEEREKQDEHRKKRQEAGKAGADARWNR